MNKLSLGPIPKIEMTRMMVKLPVTLKDDLKRYAELHAQAYGEKVDVEVLIPHMLASFLAKDRGFQNVRRGLSVPYKG